MVRHFVQDQRSRDPRDQGQSARPQTAFRDAGRGLGAGARHGGEVPPGPHLGLSQRVDAAQQSTSFPENEVVAGTRQRRIRLGQPAVRPARPHCEGRASLRDE